MAKKAARAEPDPPAPKITENEQMSDIVFILDKMELILQAVSELGKDGSHKTVPADSRHRNSFLQIDRYADMFENFLKNFWSQLKDPTRFGILSVKERHLDGPDVRQAIEDIAAGKKTDAVEEFLRKYEIIPKGKQQENTNNQNAEEMAKKQKNQEEVLMSPREVHAQQQAAAGEQQQQRAPRYNESMIDWEQLKLFGVSREYLAEKGLLDQMLRGYKTNQTVPISMNFGSAVLRTDARLSFQQSAGGPVVLAIHGMRQKPDLDRPYFGHIFSDEDKKNLLETGNMGRVVELKSRSGEVVPTFISIDRLTNEIVAMKAENVFIPEEIKGVRLTEQEINDLREGKAVYLEGMKSQAGKDFDAKVQVSAERRGIEYIFENDRVFNRQELGGVRLSKQQVEDLNLGKAIFVDGMKRKDGEYFSSFVKLDPQSGRPSYTRYNPDSPEGAREIYIPKEINGVKLTVEERDELRAGRPIFLNEMVNRRGEEFSSFIKADLETGRLSYAKTRDGFDQREQFRIPAELWGKSLTATQRAQLQDGKAVLVEGMTGFDGRPFSQYVRANFNTGRLDYYNEDPTRKRDASQRDVVAQAQERRQSQGQGQNRKPKGQSVG
ncbi:DUF3945 domain-containing protein [uncultured Duncaniella sp.]|uniref:DUF3945 domain-containing protein n=1 Tax=uncultured Duncaniella sp. TaxID=2768039 RepID=UPI0026702F40|nr:DUF3945 domain-containing protein [uncultured Duncaniella sp.]